MIDANEARRITESALPKEAREQLAILNNEIMRNSNEGLSHLHVSCDLENSTIEFLESKGFLVRGDSVFKHTIEW